MPHDFEKQGTAPGSSSSAVELRKGKSAVRDAKASALIASSSVATLSGQAGSALRLLKAPGTKALLHPYLSQEVTDAWKEGNATSLYMALRKARKAGVRCPDEAKVVGWLKENAGPLGDILLDAAMRGDVDGVRMLLFYGADKDCKDLLGLTALHFAAANAHLACSNALIKAGAKKDSKDVFGRTPLHYAVMCVTGLLQTGGQEDLCGSKESSGEMSLDRTTLQGLAIYDALLNAGADKDLKNNAGRSAADLALNLDFQEALRMTQSSSTSASMGTTKLPGKLCTATAAVCDEVTEALDNEDVLALYKALKKARHRGFHPEGEERAVGWLKANAGPLSDLLLGAAKRGDGKEVDMLLFHGADKDCKTHNGTTPLYMAAREGHAACVEALLRAGATKDAKNQHGSTPLYAAAGRGHALCVEALLQAGADKDTRNDEGATPLHHAAGKGFLACVQALLKAGADKDARNDESQTPLHLAAWKGFSDCVRALLKAGAGKDAQKENGQTPLHVAAARGSLECVNALLMAGADKDSEDIFGRSALDVAKKEDVRSLLRYFGRPKPPATKPRAKDISKQKSKSRIPPGAPLPSADQEQPDSF